MIGFVMLAVCGPTIWACFCRLRLLNPQQDKLGWGVMYLAMLAGTVAIVAEAANTATWPDMGSWLMLVAIDLNLWLTHHQWLENNAPFIAKKRQQVKAVPPSSTALSRAPKERWL